MQEMGVDYWDYLCGTSTTEHRKFQKVKGIQEFFFFFNNRELKLNIHDKTQIVVYKAILGIQNQRFSFIPGDSKVPQVKIS